MYEDILLLCVYSYSKVSRRGTSNRQVVFELWRFLSAAYTLALMIQALLRISRSLGASGWVFFRSRFVRLLVEWISIDFSKALRGHGLTRCGVRAPTFLFSRPEGPEGLHRRALKDPHSGPSASGGMLMAIQVELEASRWLEDKAVRGGSKGVTHKVDELDKDVWNIIPLIAVVLVASGTDTGRRGKGKGFERSTTCDTLRHRPCRCSSSLRAVENRDYIVLLHMTAVEFEEVRKTLEIRLS